MEKKFELNHIQELAEEFASNHLDEYLEGLKSSSFRGVKKEINDALWGTISLNPIEVALLDSPLLQRLRYVRQLGVVHWVYPGAVHTRFEHTLGVLFQVQNLASAINSVSEFKYQTKIIDLTYLQILRMSALLHDVGHAAFSHVSEIALNGLLEVELCRNEFVVNKKMESRQLSEIFAYYVVKSQSMYNLLKFLIEKCGSISISTENNVNEVVDKISDAIIGLKINDRVPLMHELVSGPFDADKLDYFVRDAKLSGIPSMLDISRLIHKLTVNKIGITDLPKEIAAKVKTEDDYYLFGIKWSGVSILDELHLSRVLLYTKIYRHPKVIAIEQMIRSAIVALAKVAGIKQLMKLLYKFQDDLLLNASMETLVAELELDKQNLDEDAQQRLEQVEEIFKSIRGRQLWVRAFGLQNRDYPADDVATEKVNYQLTDLLEALGHPQDVEEFRGKLIDELDKILSLVKEGDQNPITRTQLESMVMIHMLKQAKWSTEIGRAYLMTADQKPVGYSQYTVNRQNWSQSYMSDQPAGYIFSSYYLADAVYIAMEVLAYQEFEYFLPKSTMDFSKRSTDKIKELKRKLLDRGYYRTKHPQLRPHSERFENADVTIAIQNFHKRLSRHQGSGSSHEFTEDWVSMWLGQFEDEHLELAILLLENFRFLSRQDCAEAVKKFILDNPEFIDASVAPFGSVKDSGSVTTYFSADAGLTCESLEDIVKRGDKRPIIFIDDFVATGAQGKDILAAGFGRPDLREFGIDEERPAYSPEQIDYLKKIKVGFVFVAAWNDGVNRIKGVAKELGMDAKVFCYIEEAQLPFVFENIGMDKFDSDRVASFKIRCKEIGSDLMALNKHGEPNSKEKIDTRTLGYGNRAMLLATPINVPTQTVTAIWADKKVSGVDWIPLIRRRTKN